MALSRDPSVLSWVETNLSGGGGEKLNFPSQSSDKCHLLEPEVPAASTLILASPKALVAWAVLINRHPENSPPATWPHPPTYRETVDVKICEL